MVFAEQGTVDYAEVAQIALKVLKGDQDGPGETVQAAADGIRHLLVDEFQDTSRRQHQLLARLIGAWPDRDGRTCFVVGDPMQSIYFFRDADAELFPQVRENGLNRGRRTVDLRFGGPDSELSHRARLGRSSERVLCECLRRRTMAAA